MIKHYLGFLFIGEIEYVKTKEVIIKFKDLFSE